MSSYTNGSIGASSTAAHPAPNGAAAPAVAEEPSVILTMARYISASWTRYEELEERALNLARAEREGTPVERVLPEKRHVDHAVRVSNDLRIAAEDVILLTAPQTPAEALVVVMAAAMRLDLIACCEPHEKTPADADRIERALISAIAALRRHIPLDVGVMAEVYAAAERDVVGLAAPRREGRPDG